MSTRKVTSQKGLTPCPRCGNRHAFVAVSQQVSEDCCEVWLRCGSCGHEPDWQHRREDTWGSLGNDMVNCLGHDWNDWAGQQCHAEAQR